MYHFTTGEIQRILRLVQIWPSIVQNRDYFFINCAKPRLHCKAKGGVEKKSIVYILPTAKMTGGTPEVRSDKTLMTFNIQHSTNGPMDQRTNGPKDHWTN